MNFLKKIPFEIYLLLIWGLSIILVNPLGNFPLNDDWNYAQSVRTLCEHGKLTISDFPTATLVGQVLWGALFCKLFGFSFVTLRFSTLITSLIGILTFYKLAQYFSTNKKIVAFTSIMLFFNPLVFSLSFTFMTDVHFLTSMLLSLYFYFKYLHKKEIKFIILAILFSVISTLIRQPGLVVPLAYAFTMFFAKHSVRSMINAFIPFIITLIFLIMHSLWSHYYVENSVSVVQFSDMFDHLLALNFYQFITRISLSMLYIGLFLFPLLALLWRKIKSNIFKSARLSVIIAILSVLFLLMGGIHFQAVGGGNILYNLGLGPKLLKDATWNQNVNPHINKEIWIVVMKILSVATSVAIITLLLGKITFIKKKLQDMDFQYLDLAKICTLFTILGYAALLIIKSSNYFDRYSIPLFCCMALLLMPYHMIFSKVGTFIAISSLIVMIFFSISATHDYLSWNRSRWDAINYLIDNKKIEPTEIDGGFEFNGWYQTGPIRKQKNKEEKSWWYVRNDEYVISFGNINGFQKLKGFYYPQVLSFRNDSIYILQKSNKP